MTRRPASPGFKRGLAVAAAILVLDQISKWFVMGLVAGGSVAVIPGLFNLVTVWNRGVSFGMLGGDGALPPWILAAVAVAISAGLGVWLWRAPTRLVAVAIGLVIGGAIGNVVDRARWGAVFDFADFHVGTWHWPAFNVADSAIVVGVGVLLLDAVWLEPKRASRDAGRANV